MEHIGGRHSGNPAVAQVLLGVGTDVNAEDEDGTPPPPLDHHSESKEPDGSQVLKSAGGECNRNC